MVTASGRTKGTSEKEMQTKISISIPSLTLSKWSGKKYCGRAHEGWKDYQGLIHNTYHGGHIETDHIFICSIPEDVEKRFELPS